MALFRVWSVTMPLEAAFPEIISDDYSSRICPHCISLTVGQRPTIVSGTKSD